MLIKYGPYAIKGNGQGVIMNNTLLVVIGRTLKVTQLGVVGLIYEFRSDQLPQPKAIEVWTDTLDEMIQMKLVQLISLPSTYTFDRETNMIEGARQNRVMTYLTVDTSEDEKIAQLSFMWLDEVNADNHKMHVVPFRVFLNYMSE